MAYVFWGCLALTAATYVGYPAVMLIRARFFPRSVSPRSGSGRPAVSVVLAVRNGALWLDQRLENLMGQEYPSDRWEVIVVCNGSEDGSEAIADRWAASEPRVVALTSAASAGKAGALNTGVAAASHPLIVFADARQRFSEGAVRKLTEPFGDPAVGAVTGRLVVESSARPGVAGFGRYWELETRLRMAEAATGSVVGATGAIYAIRKELYEPVPPGTLLDDVLTPIRIALGGRRVYMATDAVAIDTPSKSERAEYRRRVRTLGGNIQLLTLLPGVLWPFRGFAWRFVFHKLLRALTPLLLIGLMVSGIVLEGPLYTASAGVLVLLHLAGLAGLVVRHPILSIPASFLVFQVAGLEAVLRPRRTAQRLWT